MLSLAFVATQGSLMRLCDLKQYSSAWTIYLLLNVFTTLKGTHFYIFIYSSMFAIIFFYLPVGVLLFSSKYFGLKNILFKKEPVYVNMYVMGDRI